MIINYCFKLESRYYDTLCRLLDSYNMRNIPFYSPQSSPSLSRLLQAAGYVGSFEENFSPRAQLTNH